MDLSYGSHCPPHCVTLQDIIAAGLECLLPSLDPWKGFTVAGPLPGIDGGKTVEVYLQRWPADKKVRLIGLLCLGLVWSGLVKK